MVVQILMLIAGFVLLVQSAGWLVDGASVLARKHRVPDLTVGLTIVAFGTSAPELVVNVFAAFQGHQDIVFGNVIGSNNFNLFIILGIAGMIAPLVVQLSTVWKEIPLSLLAVVVLSFFANALYPGALPVLSRVEGLILLLLFGFFLLYVARQLKSVPAGWQAADTNWKAWKIWGLIFAGFAGLVIGGRLVVSQAVQLATVFGVSEKVIGLTIVAAGTSLPELATSVVAAIRKNNDIAVGNIIGSNIFNILLILGISSLVRPVVYNPEMNSDLALLTVGTLVLFAAMFTGRKRKLDRWEAVLLLLIYTGYTIWLIWLEV